MQFHSHLLRCPCQRGGDGLVQPFATWCDRKDLATHGLTDRGMALHPQWVVDVQAAQDVDATHVGTVCDERPCSPVAGR